MTVSDISIQDGTSARNHSRTWLRAEKAGMLIAVGSLLEVLPNFKDTFIALFIFVVFFRWFYDILFNPPKFFGAAHITHGFSTVFSEKWSCLVFSVFCPTQRRRFTWPWSSFARRKRGREWWSTETRSTHLGEKPLFWISDFNIAATKFATFRIFEKENEQLLSYDGHAFLYFVWPWAAVTCGLNKGFESLAKWIGVRKGYQDLSG